MECAGGLKKGFSLDCVSRRGEWAWGNSSAGIGLSVSRGVAIELFIPQTRFGCLMNFALYTVTEEFEALRNLSEEEKMDYASLKSERRKRDWLAARAGLKHLLGLHHPLGVSEDWTIRKDRFGRPILCCRSPAPQGAGSCSISHTDGLAAIGWSPFRGLRLGVDVQKPMEKLHKLGGAFLAEGDPLCDSHSPLTALTLLWACKEAASKAMGLGLAVDFRLLKVCISREGKCDVAYRRRPLFTGLWGLHKGLVWAAGYLTRGAFWRGLRSLPKKLSLGHRG